ncbi:hypothetical protein M436DRAFT_86716 [Aureobasidium namibiae CBS 147.97]|uniref:Uncharacterized protein n=1 Tax=Aureobasidium namibiae CBS 147.97 TaxID=1043004 RepID=A0A074W4I6_9PEZI|nr:uncharacterized protein M436DRAFT_86716 [Aureobasidium namibiae CBS 147.97]KEQ68045.1 hypothetical protein M436DRAFT_86716 [Aureobasidium namibiae CBS 147.97]
MGFGSVVLGAAFDYSTCIDKTGFEKCYDSADSALTSCISNNCGGSVCVKSCNNDPNCVLQNCPDLGLDCIYACECIRNTKRVACAAESCWNRAYSCEYSDAVADMVDMCGNTDRNAIPYFPAPDSAPGSCSCNKGKLSLTIEKINTQITACANNQTNLDTLASTADISTHGTACLCCSISYMASAIWDICPTTQPSLLAADNITAIYGKHYDECIALLPNIDCENDLGFGAAVGAAMSGYHAINDLPANGTETLYNKQGSPATPTQATIVWTPNPGFSPFTIVAAAQTEASGKVSETATGGMSKTGSAATSASQGAASATPISNAASKAHKFWLNKVVCMVAAVVFS